jgi:hypothetical protein
MINQREEKKLESKKREWDKGLREFWSSLKEWSTFFWKNYMEKAIDWYLFNKANTPGKKALHIIAWVFVTIVIVAYFKMAFG